MDVSSRKEAVEKDDYANGLMLIYLKANMHIVIKGRRGQTVISYPTLNINLN